MLKSLLLSITYWTCFLMIVVTVRFVGIEFFTGADLGFPLYLIYLNSLPGGILMGLIWVIVEIAYNNWSGSKKLSFGITIFLKTIIYFLMFIAVMFLASWIGGGSIEYAIGYTLSPIAVGNVLASFIGAFAFVFLHQMDKKLGPGILLKYLTGKYFKPREEERIFMFMDLKSSTAIAEKVGHLIYSNLIQDCYLELTRPIKDNKGEIYQYVGDEVVISWQMKYGLEKLNCLNFFYDYKVALESKRTYFLEKYNVFPEFKAGVSAGSVMAVEVGELKTEIAFHGDVLNTASRVQNYCNLLKEQFLATETLVKLFPTNDKFLFSELGAFELRGKEKNVTLFGVSRMDFTR